jgi:NodT family efflux transporter outer membrane factor (OMF) lipoprotein
VVEEILIVTMRPAKDAGRRAARPGAALVCVAVSGLTLAGCVFDRETATPDIATPAKFAADSAGRPAPPPQAWLDSFGSRELASLGALARSQNLDIRAAAARIEQADAQSMATAAVLYPTLAAGGAASQTLTPGVARSIEPPYTILRQPLLGLNLNASYQLDFWGRNRDNAKAAALLAQASRFDRDVIALSTEATLANLYFQLLTAQDRLRVARQNVELAANVLRAIKGRRSVGTSSALDEAQQETIVAQQRANIPPLERAVGQSRNTIAVLLGVTPESAKTDGGSLVSLHIPAIRPGLPAQLLARRPDVAEAEVRFTSQGFSVDAARAAFLPNISLTGQTGLENAVLRNLLTPQAGAYALAASLAQPIFDGGALQGQLDLQKGKYKEALEDYRKQILTALADVDNGLVGLKTSREQVRLQQEATNSAKKASDAALLQLRAGTIDIVTLATTENTYFQAEDALVQARSGYFQSASTLFQALGGGWAQPTEGASAQNTGVRDGSVKGG